jgi:hypothetical protein
MMDGTTNGLSAADLALLNNSNNDVNGSWLWIFALFILFFGMGGNGFGGFNSNGQTLTDAIISTNGGYATQQSVSDQFNFAALERQNNETVAAVNQAKYDNINVMKDIQSQLQLQLSNLGTMEQAIGDKVQECCCSINRNIDSVNYNNAINTAAINANTTAQVQKVLDAITGNRMADMQNQINALELQNQLQTVVRYPSNTFYAVPSPCFNTGCGCGNI